MILLIDNYDSFVFNLAHYIEELGWPTLVRRNDSLDLAEVRRLAPAAVVLSPGPGGPPQAGICVGLIRELGAEVPILGVCLGHQCLGAAFGARIVRAPEPVHGRTSRIHHTGEEIFRGVVNPLTAARYHSLIVAREDLPASLEVTAWTDDGLVMGLRHRTRPCIGVQFHPESILTEAGHQMLANFLQNAARPAEADP